MGDPTTEAIHLTSTPRTRDGSVRLASAPTTEAIHLTSTPRTRTGSVRLAEVARRQWGVVTRDQLHRLGLGSAAITRWVEDRRLHRLYPSVYAVGHIALTAEARLAAALFYAGLGSMLNHGTCAWWWGFVPDRPGRIHVASRRRRRSLPDVCVHRPRHGVERVWHRRLPVTPPAQTLLDIAGVLPLIDVRRALAEAEYLKRVTLDEVRAVLRRGKHGSARLRAAVDNHLPLLARTRSDMEELFLLLCERYELMPDAVNVFVAGWRVDAVWHGARVVVELDSRTAHDTSWRLDRDHRRDLELRAAGYVVLRYTWRQLMEEPERVIADLRRTVAARLNAAGRDLRRSVEPRA